MMQVFQNVTRCYHWYVVCRHEEYVDLLMCCKTVKMQRFQKGDEPRRGFPPENAVTKLAYIANMRVLSPGAVMTNMLR